MALRRPPGGDGLPFLGETIPFIQNMMAFLDKRIKQFGPIFHTNILNSRTIFSCSYHTTLQLLEATTPSVDAAGAYAEFMGALYPLPNMLLSTDDAGIRQRGAVLLEAALVDSVVKYEPIVRRMIRVKVGELVSRAEKHSSRRVKLKAYAFFKGATQHILLRIILGDLPEDKYETIRKLCSDHFNGVVAAPIHFEAFGARSARAAAVKAHDKLVSTIDELVKRERSRASAECCALGVLVSKCENEEYDKEIVQLILVLLSPAVAKALASTLTSALLQLCQPSHFHLQESIRREGRCGKTESLDCVLMEAARLYPALPGGLRSTIGKTELGDYDIEAGRRVWYSAMHANRDENAYEKAEEFSEDRWRGEIVREEAGRSRCPFAKAGSDVGVKIPVTFGGGVRHCKGRDLAWMMMRETGGALLDELEVVSKGGGWRSGMRFLPVLRPVSDEAVEVCVVRQC